MSEACMPSGVLTSNRGYNLNDMKEELITLREENEKLKEENNHLKQMTTDISACGQITVEKCGEYKKKCEELTEKNKRLVEEHNRQNGTIQALNIALDVITDRYSNLRKRLCRADEGGE